MSDLNHQNFSTVQSNQQPKPATIASAATIAPVTFVTFVSGTTDIATITPPCTGSTMICLIPTNAAPGDLLTTGNIKTALTTLAQNVPLLLVWDPIENKWYPIA